MQKLNLTKIWIVRIAPVFTDRLYVGEVRPEVTVLT